MGKGKNSIRSMCQLGTAGRAGCKVKLKGRTERCRCGWYGPQGLTLTRRGWCGPTAGLYLSRRGWCSDCRFLGIPLAAVLKNLARERRWTQGDVQESRPELMVPWTRVVAVGVERSWILDIFLLLCFLGYLVS